VRSFIGRKYRILFEEALSESAMILPRKQNLREIAEEKNIARLKLVNN